MIGYLPGPVGLLLAVGAYALRAKLPFRWELLVVGYALLLFGIGQYMGLFVAPPERMMGEVARILYVHVPAAWLTLVAFTLAFGGALGYLFTSRASFDWFADAATEVGIVLGALLMTLGAIFAKPTWGVYWTWDPRLTASAVMTLTFVGVQLLRGMVPDAGRRALWACTATVVAFVNIPITYMSVRLWRSMHQVQSSPETMSDLYVVILRLNAWAFLFFTIFFIATRWRIAAARAAREAPPALPARGAA